jgi:TRAP transporter TAXI family solute receptor
VATGVHGGIYHPLGAALCRLFNRSVDDLPRCRAQISAGSTANIEALRQGVADFAIVQADTAEAARRGVGPFSGEPEFGGLRAAFLVHAEPLTLLVGPESEIDGIEGLRNKRIAVGVSGSGQRATAEHLLNRMGWPEPDMPSLIGGDPRAQVEALCRGQADAALLMLGQPNGFVQRATLDCGARIVPLQGPTIDRLTAGPGVYEPAVIPGGLYVHHPRDVPTLAARAMVVTIADQPEQWVYSFTRSAFGQADLLSRLHPALGGLTDTAMVPKSVHPPIHPGALRYLREVGRKP